MDMNYFIIGGIVVLVVAILLFNFTGNKVSKAIREARRTKDIKPLLAAVDADESVDVPTVLNSVIKSFWDSYERETATSLIRALLERNDKASISQFWLKTVREVEPEIARKQLGEEFITAHYCEEIAAGCGGCGGSCKSCKSKCGK